MIKTLQILQILHAERNRSKSYENGRLDEAGVWRRWNKLKLMVNQKAGHVCDRHAFDGYNRDSADAHTRVRARQWAAVPRAAHVSAVGLSLICSACAEELIFSPST